MTNLTTIHELGQRKQSSFPKVSFNLTQLYSDFILPPDYSKKVPKDYKIKEHSLGFLIKVYKVIDQNNLTRSIQKSFGTDSTSSSGEKRVADDLRLRPLAEVGYGKYLWWLLELPISLGSFLSSTNFDLKQLQEFANQLNTIEHIESAEPNVPYPNLVVPQQANIPGCTVGNENAPNDNLWSQRLIRLLDDSNNRLIKEDGKGIKIGLIDTGYTDHKELDINTTFDLSASTSVIEDSTNGYDPMPDGTSHGTATGSLITSAYRSGDKKDLVAGIAPRVTCVAVRALNLVVVLPFGESNPIFGQLVGAVFPGNILDAIQRCIDTDCNIINMSFGGIVSQSVQEITTEAYAKNIIMCAAAGNCVRVVVEPAVLPEVIACAAAGLDPHTDAPRPWTGTCRGPQVDISAPGENVYIADWDNGNQIVRPGEGTSYAAPHLAAAAAVWLEKHGVNNLKNKYSGHSRLADVFRTVVRESATVPAGWDTQNFGAGILNLQALMKHPLPPKTVSQNKDRSNSNSKIAKGLLDSLRNSLPLINDSVDVHIHVEKIEVHDGNEPNFFRNFFDWFSPGSEPYLLNTFYRIDGRRAKAELVIDISKLLTDQSINVTFSISRQNNNSSLVQVWKRGEQGNLPQVTTDRLVTLAVPEKVGKLDMSIRPIPLSVNVKIGSMIIGSDVFAFPGFTGVLAMLLEQDGWSNSIVDSVKRNLAIHSCRTIEEVLRKIQLSFSFRNLSVKLPEIDTEKLAKDIEKKVTDGVMLDVIKKQLWLEGAWAEGDPDDILIQDFKMLNILQLVGSAVNIKAKHENTDGRGEWTMKGSISRK